MVELDQLKSIYECLRRTSCRDEGFTLTSPARRKRIEELERKVEEPDFWDDPEESQKIMKELKDLKETYRDRSARFIPDMKMWRFFWKWDMKKRILL